MADSPPLTVLALFCDDIRIEMGGKITLVGQYGSDMILGKDAPPADRLTVLIVARWPRDYKPQTVGIKVNIPGQPQIDQPLPAQPALDVSDKPLTPFSGTKLQAMIHLRFPPLRVGDAIEVWFRADDHEFPAGRLAVREPSQQELADAAAVAALAQRALAPTAAASV